jgi:predicted transcriptional regulator
LTNSTFSIRIPDEQKDFLDRLAEATDRTRNNIISTAVGKMMENYRFVLSKIEQGEADVAAARVFSMNDVDKSSLAIIKKFSKK